MIVEKLQARADWPAIEARLKRSTLQEAESIIGALLPEHMEFDSPLSFVRHKPILWFSRMQFWEPQAGIFNEVKGAAEPSELRMSETYRRGGGLVCLGLPEEKLLSWRVLMRAAQYTWYVQSYLEQVDRLIYRGYNEKYVMGLVAASLPLSKIEHIEMYVPRNDEQSRKFEDWGWLPWNRTMTPKPWPEAAAKPTSDVAQPECAQR